MLQPYSNFAFLNFDSPKLAKLGTLAERYLRDDPNTCLIKLRQFAERLAQEVATHLGVFDSIKEEQLSLLKRLEDRGLLDSQIVKLFHEIRREGNLATHGEGGDYNIALQQLKNAHYLGGWYYKIYYNSHFRSAPFSLKSISENQTSSYKEVEENIERVTVALKSIATLIGTPQERPLICPSGNSIIPGLGMTNEAQVLNLRADNIQQGIFNLIVIGEFKNGKSTLLNAMLGDKKLPAKANPATAIITMLVYGNKEEVAIYKVNQETPEIVSLEAFKQEYELTSEDQETISKKNFVDRFKDIEFAQIQCQNSLCRGGVRLIDSPGLAEQISRTKLSIKFLKQSQAVIFVLNATQPLAQEERNFIEINFRRGNAHHVFFVVNRINQVDVDDVDEIKQYFRRYLQELYRDSQNTLDADLFNRRLFFVDAKAALQSRLENPVNPQLLKRSGLVELEQELEKFLTTSQRLNAAIGSTLDYLIPTLNELDRKIIQTKQALGQPLEELEQRRLETEQKLQVIETRETQIRNIINIYSQPIAEKLCLSLGNYLQNMRMNWSENCQAFINFDDFNPIQLAGTILNESKKRESSEKIEQGVSSYLKHHLTRWAERIPIIIKKELDELNEILERYLADFTKEIVTVESLFSGQKNEIIKTDNNKALELTNDLIMEELSHLPGTMMLDTNWFSFLGKSIIQIFLINAFLGLLGPIPWVIFLIGEITMLGLNQKGAKKKLIEKIGDKLFEGLSENLIEFQWQIRENVEEQFQNLANKVINTLQKQIKEVREEQDRIIKQKRDQSFSIEQEKLRLTTIQNEVVLLFNEISKLVEGKEHNLKEIQQMN